nr:POU domain, class 4, transcription factor 2 [Oryza sativa Japonica Group]
MIHAISRMDLHMPYHLQILTVARDRLTEMSEIELKYSNVQSTNRFDWQRVCSLAHLRARAGPHMARRWCGGGGGGRGGGGAGGGGVNSGPMGGAGSSSSGSVMRACVQHVAFRALVR